jgi:predicted transcriptional regulator of viral defense system
MENRPGGLSRIEGEVLRHFSSLEAQTIRIEDVLKLFPGSRKKGSQTLSRMAKKGWLQKLSSGVYRILPVFASGEAPIEDPWSIAMDLFKPAFISGWTAAEHWDLTEQVFNTVSLITSIPRNPSLRKIGGVEFRIKALPARRIFGHVPIWTGSRKIEMADPHRVVVDILDDPSFGGGGRHTLDIIKEYVRSGKCDGDILKDYAKRYEKGTVFKRMGFLLESFNAPVSEEWLEDCKTNISRGVSDLDPGSPHVGRISTRWNLRINLPMD